MDARSLSSVSSYTGSDTQKREIKGTMDKDDFLLLYIEQLKNQDPMEPMDTNQMASQLSQFSSVEQLVNINSGISKIIDSQMSNAVGYIGFKVNYTVNGYDTEGNPVVEEKSGIVASIVKKDGVVNLKMLDGAEVPVDRVFSVELPTTTA